MADYPLTIEEPELTSKLDYPLTIEERRMFHSTDRKVYLLLVRDLARNPLECLQIMAFWMWLERGCSDTLVHQILPLEILMISKLADEAMGCLICIKDQSPPPFAIALLSLTLDLLKKGGVCQQFLCKNWHVGVYELQKLVKEVCLPALSDIYEHACHGGFQPCLSRIERMVPVHPASGYPQNRLQASLSPANPANSSMPSSSGGNNRHDVDPVHAASGYPQNWLQASPSPANSSIPSSSGGNTQHAMDLTPSGSQARPGRRSTTTVFITFSKGFPVSEQEVSMFCNELSGNQVQAVKMQNVRRGLHPLYARVVFWSPSCIDDIVAGGNKAKFTINGKHIWMREYEPTVDTSSVE